MRPAGNQERGYTCALCVPLGVSGRYAGFVHSTGDSVPLYTHLALALPARFAGFVHRVHLPALWCFAFDVTCRVYVRLCAWALCIEWSCGALSFGRAWGCCAHEALWRESSVFGASLRVFCIWGKFGGGL